MNYRGQPAPCQRDLCVSQKSVKSRNKSQIIILEEQRRRRIFPVLGIIDFPTATLPCESASVNINWRPIKPLGNPGEIMCQKSVKPKQLFASHNNAIANSLDVEWEELK